MQGNKSIKPISAMLATSLLFAVLAGPRPSGTAVALSDNERAGAAARGIADDEPRLTPADLPGSTPVTINISPASVPAGQTVMVSGQGAAAGAKLRIAVVTDGGMLGVKEATADSLGRYSAPLPIGGTYPAGPVQLCAFATGSQNAEIACADLTVEAPPPGSVRGRIPLGTLSRERAATLDAQVQLMNAAGTVLYSAPLQPDGTFNFEKVNPGIYLYGFVGVLPTIAELGMINVEPLTASDINAVLRPLCGASEARRATTPLAVNKSRANFVFKTLNDGLNRTQVREMRPFGIYVSGVTNTVEFRASPLSTAPVQSVIFEFRGPNNEIIDRLPPVTAPFAVNYNVGRLPPSQGDRHPYVVVTPVVNGKEQCPSFYEFEVLNDPMKSEYMQSGISHTDWNEAARAYTFEGMVPYIEGVLPLEQVLAQNVPILGRIYNRFNAGLAVKGAFDLEGQARMFMAEAKTEAIFMSYPLPLPGEGRINVTPPGLDKVAFDIRNPANVAVPFGPLELYKKDLLSVPIGKIPVFSFMGIVNAYITGGLHFRVGLYLSGVVRPMAPSVDLTLAGQGGFGAEIGFSVDILLGLVEAGGGMGGEVCVNAPLRVIVSDSPAVFFDRPTIGGQLYFVIWASAFWGIFKTRKQYPVATFGPGCGGVGLSAQNVSVSEPPPLDVFVSPSMATSPGGRVLSAYVENTAAPGATPRVQVMARFQDPATGAWEAPVAISNPAHSARSPAAGFAGRNLTPMIVWAENTLTADEAAAIGEDDSQRDAAQHLNRQEIFYALWNDGWGAPKRLTDDLLADGMPEFIGFIDGGVAAWTRDMDGDAATRADQRIAVSEYNWDSETFGPITLLGDAAGGLNTDVSLAYDPGNKPVLAWVHDVDGELTTSDDRRIEVAYRPASEWTMLNPQPLPPRADSPTVSAGADGIRVAFLVREPNGAGEVGVLGTNGVLWSALYSGGAWSAQAVHDAAGENVYAEQPELKRTGAGNETLLVFRRFGNETRNSSLGQLSMSRVTQGVTLAPPAYLTDSPLQQWQPTVAINPLNNQLLVLHSTLNGAGSQSMSQSAADSRRLSLAPAANRATFSAGSNTLSLISLDGGADPALDSLQVSNRTPAPGESVSVTVTVRNLGRANSAPIRLDLYRGTQLTGTLLSEQAVGAVLGFNQSVTVVLEVTMPADLGPGGRQPLTVHIGNAGENLSTANDIASVELGGLSAPGRVAFAGENAAFEGALDLNWSGNVGEFVTGYRVYRGASASGPWSLLGESALPRFTDTSVERGKTYCYVVQAYNTQRAFSPFGEALCERFRAGLTELHLPLIARR